jgi:hypothetical protein
MNLQITIPSTWQPENAQSLNNWIEKIHQHVRESRLKC